MRLSRGGLAPGRRPMTIAQQASMARAEELRPRVSFAAEHEQQEHSEHEEKEGETHPSSSRGRGTH